jgi:predicted HicB family RNase H-like nuclease
MTKTVSARIDNEDYDQVIDLANESGQSVNEYLNELISSSIENSNTSNDSNEDEEEEN